jgi:hypothetical protein
MAPMDIGMLAHAKIVVGAPDGDLALVVGVVAIDGAGEVAGDSLEVGEHAITLFLPAACRRRPRNTAIVHRNVSLRTALSRLVTLRFGRQDLPIPRDPGTLT